MITMTDFLNFVLREMHNFAFKCILISYQSIYLTNPSLLALPLKVTGQ